MRVLYALYTYCSWHPEFMTATHFLRKTLAVSEKNSNFAAVIANKDSD